MASSACSAAPSWTRRRRYTRVAVATVLRTVESPLDQPHAAGRRLAEPTAARLTKSAWRGLARVTALECRRRLSAPTGRRGARPIAGHVSLAQLKVMSAIETCRTAALGGHVERCEDCAHERDRLQLLPYGHIQ